MKNKILIVDDDCNTKIMCQIFSKDYDLDICGSGKEALEYLKGNSPDLVLLDVMIPELDGFQVAEFISRQERFKFTKILSVSARSMIQDRLKAYDSGVHDFIAKPFDPDEISAKVKTFISLFNAEYKLERINASLAEEIKEQADAWIKNEKMALIGQQAAEIVHNLSSPLTVLITVIDNLQVGKPVTEKEKVHLEKTGLKLKVIVSSILSSTRDEVRKGKKTININDIIKNEVSLLNLSERFPNIRVNLNLGQVPQIKAVPTHITQILNNLIQNAIDAMFDEDLKILNISTSRLENYIFLKVQDSGSGIPKEIQRKIFNPLFTTKSTSPNSKKPQGSGLGLASVKRMIESYQGKIELRSELGEGTIFIISIPIHTNTSSKAS